MPTSVAGVICDRTPDVDGRAEALTDSGQNADHREGSHRVASRDGMQKVENYFRNARVEKLISFGP